MLDILYWTVRLTLVATWVVVAVRAWQWRSTVRRVWLGYSALALLFASMRAWRWNYALLDAARGVLKRAGVYDDRIWFKLILAVGLILFLVVVARVMRRIMRERAALLCGVALGMQGTLLCIETMSLDDFIPQWFWQQPVRYLVEGCFAAVALVALRRRSEPSER